MTSSSVPDKRAVSPPRKAANGAFVLAILRAIRFLPRLTLLVLLVLAW